MGNLYLMFVSRDLYKERIKMQDRLKFRLFDKAISEMTIEDLLKENDQLQSTLDKLQIVTEALEKVWDIVNSLECQYKIKNENCASLYNLIGETLERTKE